MDDLRLQSERKMHGSEIPQGDWRRFDGSRLGDFNRDEGRSVLHQRGRYSHLGETRVPPALKLPGNHFDNQGKKELSVRRTKPLDSRAHEESKIQRDVQFCQDQGIWEFTSHPNERMEGNSKRYKKYPVQELKHRNNVGLHEVHQRLTSNIGHPFKEPDTNINKQKESRQGRGQSFEGVNQTNLGITNMFKVTSLDPSCKKINHVVQQNFAEYKTGSQCQLHREKTSKAFDFLKTWRLKMNMPTDSLILEGEGFSGQSQSNASAPPFHAPNVPQAEIHANMVTKPVVTDWGHLSIVKEEVVGKLENRFEQVRSGSHTSLLAQDFNMPTDSFMLEGEGSSGRSQSNTSALHTPNVPQTGIHANMVTKPIVTDWGHSSIVKEVIVGKLENKFDQVRSGSHTSLLAQDLRNRHHFQAPDMETLSLTLNTNVMNNQNTISVRNNRSMSFEQATGNSHSNIASQSRLPQANQSLLSTLLSDRVHNLDSFKSIPMQQEHRYQRNAPVCNDFSQSKTQINSVYDSSNNLPVDWNKTLYHSSKHSRTPERLTRSSTEIHCIPLVAPRSRTPKPKLPKNHSRKINHPKQSLKPSVNRSQRQLEGERVSSPLRQKYYTNSVHKSQSPRCERMGSPSPCSQEKSPRRCPRGQFPRSQGMEKIYPAAGVCQSIRQGYPPSHSGRGRFPNLCSRSPVSRQRKSPKLRPRRLSSESTPRRSPEPAAPRRYGGRFNGGRSPDSMGRERSRKKRSCSPIQISRKKSPISSKRGQSRSPQRLKGRSLNLHSRGRSPRSVRRSCTPVSRSPRPQMRLRTRSPQPHTRSQRLCARSPRHYSRSPRRLRSPRCHSKSSRRHSKSSRRHSKSPRYHSKSPRYHSKSPRRHSKSPRCYTRLPRSLSRSLRPVSRYPRPVSNSPRSLSKSPIPLSRYPRPVSRSPEPLSRCTEFTRPLRPLSISPKQVSSSEPFSSHLGQFSRSRGPLLRSGQLLSPPLHMRSESHSKLPQNSPRISQGLSSRLSFVNRNNSREKETGTSPYLDDISLSPKSNRVSFPKHLNASLPAVTSPCGTRSESLESLQRGCSPVSLKSIDKNDNTNKLIEDIPNKLTDDIISDAPSPNINHGCPPLSTVYHSKKKKKVFVNKGSEKLSIPKGLYSGNSDNIEKVYSSESITNKVHEKSIQTTRDLSSHHFDGNSSVVDRTNHNAEDNGIKKHEKEDLRFHLLRLREQKVELRLIKLEEESIETEYKLWELQKKKL